MIHEPTKLGDFQKLVAEDLTFAYFTADWCGPCKMVSPVFKELRNVQLIKVDADAAEEIFVKYKIKSIPSIQVWKAGALIETVHGCSVDKLNKVHEKYV